MIHQFDGSGEPSFDDEGDERVGSYYQWVDESDHPLGELIGPYNTNKLAEKAAHRAFMRREL